MNPATPAAVAAMTALREDPNLARNVLESSSVTEVVDVALLLAWWLIELADHGERVHGCGRGGTEHRLRRIGINAAIADAET